MTLVARNVSKVIDDKCIVDDFSVALEPGKVVGLVGPNGAGKSTVLRMLSGELEPNDGSVEFKDENLKSMSLEALAQHRSVVSQTPEMSFDFTVEEILEMGWVQARRWGQNHLNVALSEVSSDCELDDLIGRKYRTLSGGERQRVHFARSLVQIWRPFDTVEPRFLLLDEPTSNMDLSYELLLLRTVKKVTCHGVGVLLVLHDLNLASRFVDEVVLMNQGAVVNVGSPPSVFVDEVLSSVYRTPITVEYNEDLSRLLVHT